MTTHEALMTPREALDAYLDAASKLKAAEELRNATADQLLAVLSAACGSGVTEPPECLIGTMLVNVTRRTYAQRPFVEVVIRQVPQLGNDGAVVTLSEGWSIP